VGAWPCFGFLCRLFDGAFVLGGDFCGFRLTRFAFCHGNTFLASRRGEP